MIVHKIITFPELIRELRLRGNQADCITRREKTIQGEMGHVNCFLYGRAWVKVVTTIKKQITRYQPKLFMNS